MNTMLKVVGGVVAVGVTAATAYTVYVAAKTVKFFRNVEWTDQSTLHSYKKDEYYILYMIVFFYSNFTKKHLVKTITERSNNNGKYF